MSGSEKGEPHEHGVAAHCQMLTSDDRRNVRAVKKVWHERKRFILKHKL